MSKSQSLWAPVGRQATLKRSSSSRQQRLLFSGLARTFDCPDERERERERGKKGRTGGATSLMYGRRKREKEKKQSEETVEMWFGAQGRVDLH
jgi:hypothetical protein